MMMYPFGRRWRRRCFGLNPLLVSLFSGWLLIRYRMKSGSNMPWIRKSTTEESGWILLWSAARSP